MTLKPQKIILLFIPAIVLTLGLSICFQSLLAAWTAPLANPATCLTGNPGCDAPISSGSPLVQQMQGALWIVDSAYPASLNGLIVEKGNVGIGTIAPSAKLEIKGPDSSTASQEIVRFVAGNNSYRGAIKQDAFDASDYGGSIRDMVLLGVNNGWNIAGETDIKFTTYQGGWQRRMTIQNNGNVGIGTTGPGAKLHVYEGAASSAITLEAIGAASDTTLNLKGGRYNTINTYIGGSLKSQIIEYGTRLGIFANAGNTEAISILQSNGNVGIGTTNPGNALHVQSSLTSVLRLNSTAAGGANAQFRQSGVTRGLVGLSGGWEGDSSSDMALIAETGGQLRFYTNGSATEAVMINTAGNVGIGTTNPNTKLQLADGTFSILETGVSQAAFSYGSGKLQIGLDSAGTDGIYFRTYSGGYGDRLVIKPNGNVGIGTTNPTQKLYVAGNLNVTGTAYANGQALCQANGTNCPAASTNADTVDGLHAGSFRQFNAWQNNHYSGSDGAEYATIFYDANDGGYYVNPASTSKMKEINITIHTNTGCYWISEYASASGGCPDGYVLKGISQACGEGGCGGANGGYCCKVTLGP